MNTPARPPLGTGRRSLGASTVTSTLMCVLSGAAACRSRALSLAPHASSRSAIRCSASLHAWAACGRPGSRLWP
eukprot:7677675-Alexandrium_andersonii.AAC.1